MSRNIVNTAPFQLHPDLDGGDAEETARLVGMADSALNYIRRFKWAPPVKRLYLAFAIGDVMALFLAEFEHAIRSGPDEELWIVVGDMPPAYFIVDESPDAAEALTNYCGLMEEWAESVLVGRDLSECYPIAAAPTEQHARMLKDRMETVREEFIPMARAGEIVP